MFLDLHRKQAKEARPTTTTTVTTAPTSLNTESRNHESGAGNYGNIFLKTATVFIDGPNGTLRAVGLVDDGSQRSYIRRELADQL